MQILQGDIFFGRRCSIQDVIKTSYFFLTQQAFCFVCRHLLEEDLELSEESVCTEVYIPSEANIRVQSFKCAVFSKLS